MPLYCYACDTCGNATDEMRPIDERNFVLPCIEGECQGWTHRDLRRESLGKSVHYKSFGFTRGPAIMRDPIAKGHPNQNENWGTQSESDFAGVIMDRRERENYERFGTTEPVGFDGSGRDAAGNPLEVPDE